MTGPSARSRVLPPAKRPLHRLLGAVAVTVAAATGLAAQQVEVPTALERLRVLEGEWTTDAVEFLDANGRVVRTASAESRNVVELGGLVVRHEGRLSEPRITTRSWYYWSRDDGRLHMTSVAAPQGRHDEFVGGWQGDRLVMETRPSDAYDGRAFRMVYSEIESDSYLQTLELSEDGGESWRVSSRQRMRKVGADRVQEATAILEALDAYTGHWRTEERSGPQGGTFHFEYELVWSDAGRTITDMLITRVMPDGSTTVVFEGVKGREPDGSGVYYWAASPSGRASRGEVFLEGDRLITLYDGWTADGSVVQIRDVFMPVDGDSFDSRTYLRDSAEADWRQIGADRWRRME